MVDTFAAHKLHHMYMDKQLQIWIASIRPTSGIVECPRIVIKQQNNGLCLHFDFWKVSGFFENSNGKWAKGLLYRWKTKHLMGEHPFTCWVNTLFTHGVEAPFTQVVEALFTQVVKALFTQAVHAFRGKMTMKMPWNKPWFFAVFQNRINIGRKNRKNRAFSKSRVSAKQRFFLLYVHITNNGKEYLPFPIDHWQPFLRIRTSLQATLCLSTSNVYGTSLSFQLHHQIYFLLWYFRMSTVVLPYEYRSTSVWVP